MSRPVLRGLTALAVAAGAAVAVPPAATAAPDGSGLVINEVYLNGGSAGATYLNKFVELHNPTDEDISVNGWSVQYRPYNGTANFTAVVPLGDRHLEPGGTLLVSGNSNAANGAALPTPDVASTTGFSGNANGGTIALVSSETALTGDLAAVRANASLVDLIGYGASNTYEGAPKADGYSVTASVTRAAGVDTDANSTDFTTAAPTPVPCGATCAGPGDAEPEEPEPSETVTIAQIQGTGAASPRVGQTVTTTGVVTALYASGGFNGAYIQTPGTGGTAGPASHGLFVFGSSTAFAQSVDLGDTIDVTGAVSEFNGLTQITAASWKDATTAGTVTPTPVTFPMAEAQRESLEGMLVDATAGTYTITNNYGTNTFGELGLAAGDTVLPQPTNEVRPRTSAYDALVAQNAARMITLDDGKSINFTSGTNRASPGPWLTPTNEVRTGASVTIDDPLVLDWRNSTWKLQPTQPFAAGGESATIAPQSTRETAPKDVGGAVKLASFNVLNYFTTTGEDWVSSNRGTCTWYTDRDGNRITVNTCTNNGPRGAANDVSLARQQAKIVKAINTLDADVLSLEEIEDTGSLGGADRDEALKTLVAALNADAGSQRWAAVLSPSTIPTSGRDVIRTAFIYQRDAVEPVGPSVILDSPAFANARAPLAQEFRPVDGDAGQDFLAIVNHFKSKGSGDGVNADQGDGQGASNRARVGQAEALVDFVNSLEAQSDTDRVFLLGDFNSYAKEDPLAIIEDAGFVNVDQRLTDEETYQFEGMHGSLDHVFASSAAFARVTGADVWTINAPESIGREYSRFNNNVTNLFDASTPFRASDHDPVIVGFDPGAAAEVATTTTAKVPSVVWADEAFDVAVTVGSATGSPRGTATVSLGDEVLGTATVADGSATVTVPAGSLRAGRHVLDVAFAGEGRYADSAGTVAVDVRADSAITATAARGTYGKPTAISVTGAPDAGGLVYATVGGRIVASAIMRGGRATINVPGTALRPGTTAVTVFYGGDRGHDASQTSVAVTIAKAKATVSAKVLNGKVTPRTRAKVRVVVRTPGFVESSGKVRIYRGSKLLGSGNVKGGKVTVTLPRQKSSVRLTARFSGTSLTAPASRAFVLRVR
ncbi:ExeM/NucH family extracellular endonuclease [Aeromicrobium choanae]|uniref:LTD domain-containing protein n=1 Tax=Aeromicrobium choanae TaxID=1736691 RepID=A0A1T4Z1X9_9ACTN|nr:ExeM/NucH family extracellular endonuclease [Aeromicrobium choanae]SKB07818.1 hypothetical protein SAMN06295964_1842 [Aeromicrobium choanae]